MEIIEYDLYDFVLSVTIATERPDAAPSAIIQAATLHEEYAAKVRCLLREYRNNLGPYLPYYGVRQIQPAGSAREIQNNYDITRLQFSCGLTMLDAAKIANETLVFALERNIEKACNDLFAANDLPNTFIPDATGVLGPSYIQIIATMGGASNQGAWQVPA